MTRTGATLATIGTVIGAPLLAWGVLSLIAQAIFWKVIGIVAAIGVGCAILFVVGVGLFELWGWFRRNGWRKPDPPRPDEEADV